MAKSKRIVRGSKRYKKAVDSVDREKRYDVSAAVEAIQSAPAAKFDETIDLVVRLTIDLKRNDGGVRGTLTLPHGIGKTKTVIAFCEGDLIEAATAAGAIEAGGEELVNKVKEGWSDFDVAVAHPSMMRFVGQLGRVLGPLGKMPSPKSGTVTDKVVAAVTEFAAGKVEFRTDGGGNVHMPVGKRSFEASALTENIEAAIEHLHSVRPAAAKGTFLKQAHVSSTMGPGLELSV